MEETSPRTGNTCILFPSIFWDPWTWKMLGCPGLHPSSPPEFTCSLKTVFSIPSSKLPVSVLCLLVSLSGQEQTVKSRDISAQDGGGNKQGSALTSPCPTGTILRQGPRGFQKVPRTEATHGGDPFFSIHINGSSPSRTNLLPFLLCFLGPPSKTNTMSLSLHLLCTSLPPSEPPIGS